MQKSIAFVLLYRYTTMHGQQNIKFRRNVFAQSSGYLSYSGDKSSNFLSIDCAHLPNYMVSNLGRLQYLVIYYVHYHVVECHKEYEMIFKEKLRKILEPEEYK
jgi:hypothetical protein